MKGREAWRHPVAGTYSGAFLQAVGDVAVFGFSDRDRYPAMGALSADGTLLWAKRWTHFAYFEVGGERLYVDGDKARRVSASTGSVEAERGFGRSVEIRAATAAGPIYRIPEEQRYFGLDGETLATLWEWVPDEEDFTCHEENRLCRYRTGEGITMFQLPSLTPIGPVATPPLSDFALHGHAGDLWCHFSMSGGGRAAIDLGTGRVAWREAEPDAYGLVVFDADRAYSPRDALSAYDLRTGRLAWRREFGGIPTSMPSVAEGRVYVATADKFVHVVEARTGEPLFSHPLDFKITGMIEPSPAVPFGARHVLVGTHYAIICIEMG